MSELEEREEIEDEAEDLEPDDDEVDEAEAELALPDEDDEGEESSLEALLAQRAAGRRAREESEDDDDIMSFPSNKGREPLADVTAGHVIPIKDRQEFVCNRCHLVKARSQLADPQRGLCRDCV